MPAPYHINMHTHCFTLAHVPEEFFNTLIGGKRFLAVSKLMKPSINSLLIWLFTRQIVINFIGWFSKDTAKQLSRLKGLLKFRKVNRQQTMLEILKKNYAEWMPDTQFRFVPLTMDMEYMAAGDPAKDYRRQLDELKFIKSDPNWKDIIYPFVFADPSRGDVLNIVKEYIEDEVAPFSGIKLYPALGYFPFDKNLRGVYEYAIQKNLPLVTHCIDGSVYNRKKPQPGQRHPITNADLHGANADTFQLNWTHPLNYECLLNQQILKTYWGHDAPDLSQLKICLGHFGGEGEWLPNRNMMNFFTKRKAVKQVANTDYLDISHPWFGKERHKWLLIIIDLLRKYPNVYADISFTLHDKAIYRELKELLKDETINRKILFGTDYYVVASEIDEADLLNLFKKELNDDVLFDMIAYENPKRFLGWS